jgi:hypothetical protein
MGILFVSGANVCFTEKESMEFISINFVIDMHKMLSCLISKRGDQSLEIKNIIFSVNGVVENFTSY